MRLAYELDIVTDEPERLVGFLEIPSLLDQRKQLFIDLLTSLWREDVSDEESNWNEDVEFYEAAVVWNLKSQELTPELRPVWALPQSDRDGPSGGIIASTLRGGLERNNCLRKSEILSSGTLRIDQT